MGDSLTIVQRTITLCDNIQKILWIGNTTHWEHHTRSLMAWHEGGLSSPWPRLKYNDQLYPEQPDIWKLATATQPPEYWKGSFSGTINSRVPLTHLITMCPFILMLVY